MASMLDPFRSQSESYLAHPIIDITNNHTTLHQPSDIYSHGNKSYAILIQQPWVKTVVLVVWVTGNGYEQINHSIRYLHMVRITLTAMKSFGARPNAFPLFLKKCEFS